MQECLAPSVNGEVAITTTTDLPHRRRAVPLRAAPIEEPPAVHEPRLRAAPREGLPALPDPPCPPFTPTSSGWRAIATGRRGRKVTVDLTERSIALDGFVIDLADVEHATIAMSPPGDQGLTVRYALVSADGDTVEATTSAITARGSEPLLAVANHLWKVLCTAVGPRLRAELVRSVLAGDTVSVAGLDIGPKGVAPAGDPSEQVSWMRVGAPGVRQRAMVTPVSDRQPFVTPLSAPDAFLLPDLLPELRSQLR